MKLDQSKAKILLLVLFTVEFLLFFGYYSREILPFHPEGWDQVEYYNNSFRFFNYFLQREWQSFYNNLGPQGVLLQVTTAFSYFFTGISKLNGPIIVFFMWLLSQYLLFQYFAKQLNDKFGFLMLGLFLATHSYYNIVGGIVDFRLDIAGGLLYGISLLMLIDSQRHTNKQALNYFVVTVLTGIVVRTNLSMLFIPIMFLYSLYLLLHKQCKPLLWFNSLATPLKLYMALVGLYLFAIKEKFYMYYLKPIISQNTDNLVNTMHQAMGIDPGAFWNYYFYYLINFSKIHLGFSFLAVALILLIFLTFSGIHSLLQKVGETKQGEIVQHDSKNIYILSFLYILIPLLLYTVNDSKNPVVATTLVIPFFVLLGQIIFSISSKLSVKYNLNVLKGRYGFVFLTLGVIIYLNFVTSTRVVTNFNNGPELAAREINKRAIELNLNEIKLSLLDFNELNGSLLQFYGFLHHNRLINYQTLLPVGFELPTDRQVIEKVAQSDVVLDNFSPGGTNFLPVAYNKNISHYRTLAMPILQKDFIKVGNEFKTDSGTYYLYFRPRIVLDNPYKDWLADEFELQIPQIFLGKIKTVTIEGVDQTYLKNKDSISFDVIYFGVEAENMVQQTKIKPLYHNGKYILSIEIPKEDTSRIKLRSSISFNPLKLGINQDTRNLVFLYPDAIKVEKR